MNGLFKLVATSVALITAACATAVLLVPPVPQEHAARREAEARRLVESLADAAWQYFAEQGEFPPGDGSGTAPLVEALGRPSRSGQPYMRFLPFMLTPRGDVRNPVRPEEEVVHYVLRRPASDLRLPLNAEPNFELWCRSADGRPRGITVAP